MDRTLSDDTWRHIEELVEAGRFESAEQAVRSALETFLQIERGNGEKLLALRALIQEGLDSGPPIRADEAFWEDFWAQIEARKQEIAKRAASG